MLAKLSRELGLMGSGASLGQSNVSGDNPLWGVWSGTGAGSDIRVGRRIGGLISVFGERSASVGEVFIFAGGWALGYHSMGFQRFPGIS